MDAYTVLNNILDNDNLNSYPFKFCLVDDKKCPYTLFDTLAKPNNVKDFCSLEDLVNKKRLNRYRGIGISIQGSDITAIDVDHCFSNPFEIETISEQGNEILKLFEDKTYCEFSFSGTGMRILFQSNPIENYRDKYYVKNSKKQCEFYHPTDSARYVTITGVAIANNPINKLSESDITKFLDSYMKLNLVKKTKNEVIEHTDDVDKLVKKIRVLYVTDYNFQSVWFDKDHYKSFSGGSLESDRDFYLARRLYEEVTQDYEQMKLLFEMSPYFKTKDKLHMDKWNYGNNRYFKYIYKVLSQ